MESLQGLGNVVGEYVGDGQGEAANEAQTSYLDEFLDVGVTVDHEVDGEVASEEEDDISDLQPLVFAYDCETTGLSIYNDHVIEIAAEVVQCPVPYSKTTYCTLVKTSRRIPAAGVFIRTVV